MTKRSLIHEQITNSVLGCFFEVYNNMGHGALESLHLAALEREIRNSGHRVARELNVRVMYKGEEIGMQRLDMVVDDVVVIEAKSSEDLPRIAHRQLFNYLRITNLEVGLLLHFGLEPRFCRVYCEQDRKPWRRRRLATRHFEPPVDPSASDPSVPSAPSFVGVAIQGGPERRHYRLLRQHPFHAPDQRPEVHRFLRHA